jgi:two-component system chemotaxis sensor kinase CheA
LEDALFADGLSTREEVSATSGRGVGLGAVRAEVERRGGRWQLSSTRGLGTTWEFRFPMSAMNPAAGQMQHASLVPRALERMRGATAAE